MNKLNSKSVLIPALMGIGMMFYACSPSSSQEEVKQEEEVQEIAEAVAPSSSLDSAQASAADTTEWPDEVDSDGSFQEAEEGAEESSDAEGKAEETASSKPTPETKEGSTEAATAQKTASSTTSSTTTTKMSTSSTASTSTTASKSTKAITSKLTKIYGLKTSIGNKLDCMRVSPLAKIDRVKAGQLHDKYVGILPKMLPWVRFNNDEPQILKTDPEKLEKLSSLSDGWMKSYQSIESQADQILDKYKEKDFYKQCNGE